VVRPPQDDVRVPREELVAAAIGPGRSRRDPVLIGAPVPRVPRPVVEDHVVGEIRDVDPAAYLLVVAADRANAAPGSGLPADRVVAVDRLPLLFLAAGMLGHVPGARVLEDVVMAPIDSIDVEVGPAAVERWSTHLELQVAHE